MPTIRLFVVNLGLPYVLPRMTESLADPVVAPDHETTANYSRDKTGISDVNLRIDTPRDQIAAFCGRWQVTELALFGSVLREDFGPDSDIDVLVRFDRQARHTLLDIGHRASRTAGDGVMARASIDRLIVDLPYEESARLCDFRWLDVAIRLAYDPPTRASRNRSESDWQPTLQLLDFGER